MSHARYNRVVVRSVGGRTEKRCTGPCREWLPLSEFYRCSRAPLGLQQECRRCNSERKADAAVEAQLRTVKEVYHGRGGVILHLLRDGGEWFWRFEGSSLWSHAEAKSQRKRKVFALVGAATDNGRRLADAQWRMVARWVSDRADDAEAAE